jgi:hypothetical protein
MARALRCALYGTARNGVFSAGTLATLARWLKSVGRRCVPTSTINGSKSPVAKWLGAGNCPEPAHQGVSRRAGPCPARRVPPSCRGALRFQSAATPAFPTLATPNALPAAAVKQRADAVPLAVRDAEPLPELHAARPAARLPAELLHVRRESLRGMPGAHTRAISRMSKAADLYPPSAGVFDHFDLDFLHRGATFENSLELVLREHAKKARPTRAL